MKTVAIIPARYASTRLPGKPILNICGKPMVQWVWEAACSAGSVDSVIIAVDDERVSDVAKSFGAEVVMTPIDLPSGTDRAAYVIRSIYPSDRPDAVLNVQVDEPLLTGEILDRLVGALAESNAPIATIIAPATEDEVEDPNTVKVVLDRDGNALYFSRAEIPFHHHPTGAQRRKGTKAQSGEFRMQNVECRIAPHRDHQRQESTNDKQPNTKYQIPNTTHYIPHTTYSKHIGIYAFRTGALLDFAGLKPTPLELAEKLEQLRALEHGWKIECVLIPEAAKLIGVDTEEDLEKVKAELSSKPAF